LYKAVKNKSVDYLKSKYAKLKFETEDSAYEIPDNTSADNNIEEKQILIMARKALDILPEKCHIIFSLSTFGELSSKQIARQLKISVKTVQNQIIIANKKITVFLNNQSFACAIHFLISIPVAISL
jgi:RNA polymerase sigma factor (sigma-70 family)